MGDLSLEGTLAVSGQEDLEKTAQLSINLGWKWENDPHNPYNWPKWKKNVQLGMVAFTAFSGSVGTSMISPAHLELMEEFNVSTTVAFLPLSLYVLALGLGPVMGGPLSETVGRLPIYYMAAVLGGLFSLGAGLTHSFAGLCILRFLAGFFYAPSLAIGAGVLSECYLPMERGIPSIIFILCPFLGPGLGPVLGVFTLRKGWRWSQYTLVFFSIAALLATFFSTESYHRIVMRRRMKKLGIQPPTRPSAISVAREFLTIGVLRPLSMMFTEPIVGFLALYVACNFGTLFGFFGAMFYIFETFYNFSPEEAGLVFLAIVVGCIVGAATVAITEVTIYRPKARLHESNDKIPPEYRLYPALIGSIGLPASEFWFAWTAGQHVHPAAPIVAIVVFAWGNICVFVSAMQYIGDTYNMTNIASASSANSFARYGFAAAFPLFVLQMYQKLGTPWATSLLGFVSLILLPVPWLLFKFGETIRAKCRYELASY